MSIEVLVNQYIANVERRKALRDKALTDISDLEDSLADLRERTIYLTDIASFLSSFADERQAELHRGIESVVSVGLKRIFEEDLSLKLVPKMVGSRAEIDFVLVSKIGNEKLETNILESRGGGVAAVTGFLIQVVLVMLNPKVRNLIFLDETFAQVSIEFRPNLAKFVKELTENGLQIVMVTHDDTYKDYADKMYRFTQEQGITTVKLEA